MRSWMIAFSAGVVLAGFVPELPAFYLSCLLLFGSLLLHAIPALRLPAAFLCGVGWFLVWAFYTERSLWVDAERADEVLVQGRVWSVPQAGSRGSRFEFMLDALCSNSVPTQCVAEAPKRKVLLSTYERMDLAPGQYWMLLVRLHRPHGFSNPGGFDYEAWQLQQKLVASGYVRTSELNRLLPAEIERPWFHRLRFYLLQLLSRHEAHWQYGALLRALTLGDKSGISDEQWRLFTTLGINHLMVISGLHIGLVAALMLHCGSLLSRCSVQMLLSLTAPRMGAIMAGVGAVLYAGLAGFSLPALRAMLMVLVYLSGKLLLRQTLASNALCQALVLILLLDPLAPQSAGFWLSFVAVAILLCSSAEPCSNKLERLWQIVKVQLLLSVGMLPVMLVFFQQSSVLAPLVNLLAIPYIGLLVVPLGLLGLLLLPIFPQAASGLLQAGDFLLYVFMQLAQKLVQTFPASLLDLPQLPVPALLMLLLLLLAMFCLRHKYIKPVCLLLLPLLLWLPRKALQPGDLRITVVDVGQGLAVLVSSAQQHLLYDTGPGFSDSFDAGTDVLLPLLRKQGVRQLQQVIVSHGDLDHIGGLPAIEAAFPDALYAGPETQLFSATVDSRSCAGQEWSVDGIQFQILHPEAGNSSNNYSRNNSSCVLRIDTGKVSVLLPGDIERPVELALLERFPNLQADILLAPHHGSNSSSSSAFIKTLNPEYVVFSAGYQNRFGHPTAVISQRYQRVGVRAFNTANSGAITFSISGKTGQILVTRQRQQHPRFWFQVPASTI